MRGRRPKPTELLKLTGTIRRDRHSGRAHEPLAEGAPLEPPADLTDSQRDIWAYTLASAPRGVLKSIDSELLRLWVVTVARHREAEWRLAAERPALWATSPAQRVLNQTTSLLIRLCSEFGFSPASRPRLRAEPPAPAEPNPWASFRMLRGDKKD